MIASEYLLLAALVLGGAGFGLSKVRDGIVDTATDFQKHQMMVFRQAHTVPQPTQPTQPTQTTSTNLDPVEMYRVSCLVP